MLVGGAARWYAEAYATSSSAAVNRIIEVRSELRDGLSIVTSRSRCACSKRSFATNHPGDASKSQMRVDDRSYELVLSYGRAQREIRVADE